MAHSATSISHFQDPRVAKSATITNEFCEYEVNCEDGSLSHSEIARKDNSEVLYKQSKTFPFVVGSGKRGYSFLCLESGALFQSPLTWYAEKTKWDLSPGYQPESHPRFERRVSDGCVACHFGQMSVDDSGPHRFDSKVVEEFAIGCERCHGPGEKHVLFHSGQDGIEDVIVNPETLSPSKRESVCYQCHLHGAERILRDHRSEFDFRPGDELSDVWNVVLQSSSVNSNGTTAVSQVEQIRKSRCFLESSGRLGCTSCHDPHGTPPSGKRITFYRNRCLNCHGVNSEHCNIDIAERKKFSSEDSCIDCHMPKLAANDVPHTSQTDHRILRAPDRTSPSVAGSQLELELFDENLFQNEPEVLQRALGIHLGNRAVEQSSSELAAQSFELLDGVLETFSDDPIVLRSQSENLFQLKNPQARFFAESALQFASQDESTLEILSLISIYTGRNQDAIEYTKTQLALTPWNSVAWMRLGILLEQEGNFMKALEAAERATEINPRFLDAHRLVQRMAITLDKNQLAAKHQSLIEALDADY